MAISELDVLREISLLGECRAAEIQGRLSDKTGQEVQFGLIFVYLERLGQSGDIVYRLGDADRKGCRRRYYRSTDGGRGKLVEAARSGTAGEQKTKIPSGAIPQT